MQNRIKKLKDFVEEYGIDFLGDGTKDRIVSSLEKGDKKLALEILGSIDSEWIERTKEIQKFLIFTDMQKGLEKEGKIINPFFKANYIDSIELETEHIPTLRRVVTREQDLIYDLRGWEIDD